MERDIKNLQMDLFIKVDMSMESLKGVGDINGPMDRFIKGNGEMASSMGLEFGEVLKEIRI